MDVELGAVNFQDAAKKGFLSAMTAFGDRFPLMSLGGSGYSQSNRIDSDKKIKG
jgi:hypothetical protein